MSENKRITWVDVAKGWAILCVILGHTTEFYNGTNFFKTVIYTFHMPIFFFLSGFTFNGQKYKPHEFVLRKIKTVVIPYFCLGAVMIGYEYVYNTYLLLWKKKYDVAGQFMALLTQNRLWTLWFLTTLFVTEILFYFIVKLWRNKLVGIGATCVVLSALGMVYYSKGGATLPWNVDAVLPAITFFFAGYLLKNLKKVQEVIFDHKLISFVICVAVDIVCTIGSYRLTGRGLEMFFSSYGFPPLVFIAAIAGSLAVCLFSAMLPILPIRYIGKHSMLYFAWHQTIMIPEAMRYLAKLNILQKPEGANLILCYAVILVFTVVVTTSADWIIRNTFLRFMVGASKPEKAEVKEA